MKIIQVTPAVYPSKGGVETHLKEVNAQLKKIGHQPHIYTLDKKVGRSKFSAWKRVWQDRKLFKEADIIQVHDVMWWLLPVLPLIWRNVLITFHGWEGECPIPWRYKLHRWLANKLARGSIHVGSWIQEFYWDKPDLITYGGVKINRQTRKKKRLSGRSKSKNPHFVFVGRLEPENDINKYLQLVARLKKTRLFKNLKVTWVGDGSFRKKCSQLGMVTGMVDNVEKHLMAADLVGSASYLSLLQSQAHGKITCALYSHPLKKRYLETYPGSGYLVLTDSVPRAARTIIKLWQSPSQKKKLEGQARIWARQQTWLKVAKLYLKLWQAKSLEKPQRTKLKKLVIVVGTNGFGGAENFILDLCQQLKKLKLEILLVSNFLPLLKQAHRVGIKTEHLPFFFDVIGDWKGLVKSVLKLPAIMLAYLRLIARNSKADLFLLVGFPEKLIASWFIWIWRKPQVWIEFGPLGSVINKFWHLPKFLYLLAKGFADLVIMPSENSQRQLIDQVGHSLAKTMVVACGRQQQNLKLLRAQLKELPSKVDPNKPIVVCVSRLEPGKGQNLLIKAFAKVIKKVPSAQLLIVGEGDFQAELLKLTNQLDLSSKVFFLGRVKDSLAIMKTATVCVFPSRWSLEGFGLVSIEAMSLGKPLVAFDRAPGNEIIRDKSNGLLAKDGNLQDLARKLVRLLQSPSLRKKLGQRARQDFNSGYTIDKVGLQYLKTLQGAYYQRSTRQLPKK